MIVAYGDAIVDFFALPLGCEVADAEQFVPRQGGAPANVAVVAARLGAATRFVGAVGRDAHGERLVREMRGAGVDTGSVVQLPNRTGVTFVRVGPDGARSFLFYRQSGADLSLEARHLDALEQRPLRDATWLYLTSSAMVMEPKATATRRLLAQAEQSAVPIVVDLNVRAHLWDARERMISEVHALVKRAALVKASEEDLAALGLEPSLAGMQSLRLRPNAVGVLTLAERGATCAIADETVSVPAPSVRVVDATGAGDAFVAGVLASLVSRGIRADAPAWSEPDTWRRILAFACRIGARAVTAIGATEALRDLAAEQRSLRD